MGPVWNMSEDDNQGRGGNGAESPGGPVEPGIPPAQSGVNGFGAETVAWDGVRLPENVSLDPEESVARVRCDFGEARFNLYDHDELPDGVNLVEDYPSWDDYPERMRWYIFLANIADDIDAFVRYNVQP